MATKYSRRQDIMFTAKLITICSLVVLAIWVIDGFVR